MIITISLVQLFYIILALAAIVLIVYLILLAKNAYTIVKMVKGSLDKTKLDQMINNIDDTARNVKEMTDLINEHSKEVVPMIPQITRDVQAISSSSKKSVKNIEETMEAINDGVSRTSEAIASGTENTVSYIKIIVEVFKTIFSMFSKDDD